MAPVDGSGGFPRSFFEEHVREKSSTYAWLFESMLERAGFSIEDVSYAATRAHARYICVRPA